LSTNDPGAKNHGDCVIKVIVVVWTVVS